MDTSILQLMDEIEMRHGIKEDRWGILRDVLEKQAAEQSVQSDECPHCHAKPAYTDQQTYPDICSECGTRR